MRNRTEGFTLIEVMVALTIFAAGAITLSFANTTAVRSSQQMETRTFARWIAKNEMTEVRSLNFPEPGESEKKVHYAGRDWEVRTTIKTVNMKYLGNYLRQVQIGVYLQDKPDQQVDQLFGIVGDK